MITKLQKGFLEHCIGTRAWIRDKQILFELLYRGYKHHRVGIEEDLNGHM